MTISQVSKEYIELIPNLFKSFQRLNQKSSNLTHLQNQILEFVFMNHNPVTIKQISEGLNVPKQQMTDLLKRLFDWGYITKSQNKNDKRSFVIELTEKGKTSQQEKWTKIYQSFVNDLSKLDSEEQQDLQYALHKVNYLLKKMED
ncbi:Organic hydroperoxide resistance transcriptional regulator [Peribacillus sp. Bi96]|uniref:MarR family winged helix-turn-helix transcriptional regulator n=1 Tax=unclassified Peribacillus TaxID=2675266 RepID=UPI001D8B39A8|nr:MarR family winged helix-turn-helix transcriptional regulator [Peribacillus sp. Bi96]CAH0257952.1 Organic hydroperoxide resistance transcriptional regulator [Peribacillus sp. Bi96]